MDKYIEFYLECQRANFADDEAGAESFTKYYPLLVNGLEKRLLFK